MSIEGHGGHFSENRENEKELDYVMTEKGSMYRFLPDGTTQRYKTAEQQEYEPQAAIVFVPDFETVKKSAPADFDVEAVLGENETQYGQSLLERVQGEDSRNYIVNSQGVKLDTNEAIQHESEPIFLTFGTESGVDFHLPVSKEPKVGYAPFDTRKYYDDREHQWKRERHLGNRITEIQYK